MAITITPFSSPHNVTKGQDFNLNIPVHSSAGGVHAGWVTGELHRFRTNLNTQAGRIEVRGIADELLDNQQIVVHARDADGTRTHVGAYSVVPAAPVITTIGATQLYRSAETSIVVPVSGDFSQQRVTGLFSGLGYGAHDDGVEISGFIPDGRYPTSNSFTVWVSNGTDTDSHTFTFAINVLLELAWRSSFYVVRDAGSTGAGLFFQEPSVSGTKTYHYRWKRTSDTEWGEWVLENFITTVGSTKGQNISGLPGVSVDFQLRITVETDYVTSKVNSVVRTAA